MYIWEKTERWRLLQRSIRYSVTLRCRLRRPTPSSAPRDASAVIQGCVTGVLRYAIWIPRRSEPHPDTTSRTPEIH